MKKTTNDNRLQVHERQNLRELDQRLKGIRAAISSEIMVLSKKTTVSEEVQHELIPGLKAARYALWSAQRDIHDLLKASQVLQ